MPESDNASDTELLRSAVREAGAIAKRYFGGQFRVWNKGGNNPVTDADIAVDTFLKETLLARRPEYGWLSEETVDDFTRLSREHTFVVDPIDGTYGFVKGRPQFTVVAAIVREGRPTAGVIYNPLTEELYDATLGKGAHKNGRPICVSNRDSLRGARLLATSTFLETTRWKTPWPEGITVESRASIAYRMALVAEGAFDAMVSLSRKSDWDLAAADLIVREAKGYVTTVQGEPILYNGDLPEQKNAICAGPALHALLVAKLAELEEPDKGPLPRAFSA